jgi:hypothetical protein
MARTGMSATDTTCSYVAVAFQYRSRKQAGYNGYTIAGLLTFTTLLWAVWYYVFGSERNRMVMHISFGVSISLALNNGMSRTETKTS